MCWSIWTDEIKFCPSLSQGVFVIAYEALRLLLSLFPQAMKNIKTPKL